MSKIDDLLQRIRPGLTYEKLNFEERETLDGWLKQLSAKALTIEDVKKHIRAMISSVEQELSAVDNDGKKDIFLKARLRNYLLLEAFLTAPERAKEVLENQLKNLERGGGKK